MRAAGIVCAEIGEVVPADEGIRIGHEGAWRDLPRYDQDEIAKLFLRERRLGTAPLSHPGGPPEAPASCAGAEVGPAVGSRQ